MPISGHDSTVKVSGTPTGMVAEATTEVTANVLFQITAAAKRIIDPDAALTVLVNAAPVTTGFVVDYLFGTVTFDPPLTSDVVTLTGNYLPTLAVLDAREFSVVMSRLLADSTVFKTSPHRTRQALLKDASGSIGTLAALHDDLDPGGGSVKLIDLLADGTRKLLEVVFGNSGYAFRAWILFESEEVNGVRDDLVNSSLGWQLAGSSLNLVSYGIGLV